MKKYIILILILLISFHAEARKKIRLKKVEPAFWWTGMNNPNLQLLIYGENISLCHPVINYTGVKIRQIIKVENPNYLFINLFISETATAGSFHIKFMNKKKEIARYKYKLLNREENSALRKGFDNSDVIYLIMPDRFSNGDTSNDNTVDTKEKTDKENPGGRHGGDIQGIINHLDYLNNMGITTLWCTPMFLDDQKEYSYHGYAISDYYKIDPRYGNNSDYKRLSSECKRRNMKLILDVVTNHCGIEHWWLKDLPCSDWIHHFPTFTRSNYRMNTINDPYSSKIDHKLNIRGWFDTTMPDLNQNNPLLLTYLIQNTIWWIEYANLNGIRIDTYVYNHKKAMSNFCKSIMQEYPNFNIVGECWQHYQSEISYWQKDAINHDNYNSFMPTVMDFPLHDILSQSLHETQSWDRGINRFYLHYSMDYLYKDPFRLLVFADNHDTDRFSTNISRDLNKFKLAYTLLLTSRGIPQIYYGSEIMMTGNKSLGDGDLRKDFPGGWPTDTLNCFTSSGRTIKENEAFNFLQRLLNYRKENPVIHSGKMKHYIPENECYIYFRYNNKKTIMIILNNDESESKQITTNRFSECIKDFKSGKDIITGEILINLSRINIPPKSSMIIELYTKNKTNEN